MEFAAYIVKQGLELIYDDYFDTVFYIPGLELLELVRSPKQCMSSQNQQSSWPKIF